MNMDVKLISSTGAPSVHNLLQLGLGESCSLRQFLEKSEVSLSGYDRSKRYTVSHPGGSMNANENTIIRGGYTVQVVKTHDNG